MTQINVNTLPALPCIIGPTASGKTALAVKLAEHFRAEIISADSRQVYRGMDIGTGKDLHEYGSVPYHLIDIVDPGHEYNLFEFARDFCHHFQDIHTRKRFPILVGGTAMYVDAVLSRYDLIRAEPDPERRSRLEQLSDKALQNHLLDLKPKQHNTTDLDSRSRLIRAIEIAEAEQQQADRIQWPAFKPLVIGIQIPREIVRQRITRRLKQRLQQGMIEEVEQLHDQGLSWEQLDFFGLEYRFIARYLKGELSYNDMYQKLNSAIHQFAKQQDKWFRKFEQKGHAIHWISADDRLEEQAREWLEQSMNLTLRTQ